MDIPTFEEAIGQMQSFLLREGHNDTVRWIFCDDAIQHSQEVITVRLGIPTINEALARKVYEEGREKGIISITALGTSDECTMVAVWYPKHKGEEVQGWNRGLKLSIRKPIAKVKRISSFLWPLMRCTPAYRRNQKYCTDMGTRKWATA